MEYIVLLQRGWQIITRHKVLWLFGLIAVLAGQDAVFNLRGATRIQPLPEAIVNLPLSVANALRSIFASDSPPVSAGVMLIAGLGLLAIGAAASAALIGLTQAAERGEWVDVRSGVRIGLKRAKTLVAIRLIFNLPFTILSFLISVVLVRLIAGRPLGYLPMLQALEQSGWLTWLLLLGLIVGAIVGAIELGADRACVLEGAGVLESIRRGWEVPRKFPTKYIVITGIFIASTLLTALIIFCPLSLILTEQVSQLVQNASPNIDFTSVLLREPLGIVIGLALLALYILLTTYVSIIWTLAWRRYA